MFNVLRKRAYSTLKPVVNLSGIFPPIATPFHEDENLAYDKLEENIRKWNNIPFSGYVVQGSNGEYPLLSIEERVEMVRTVRRLIAPEKLLIAGSTCESTRMTIELTNEMASAGANAVMVLCPSYFKNSMTFSALKDHFTKVADASRVPVILYNMPGNTGIDMSAALITSLASHPNIIGIKDSGGDITKIATVVKDTKDSSFQVIAGSTGFLLPALLVGCVGGFNGLANILGHQVCQLYQLYKESRLREAIQLHQRLLSANTLVTREWGVPAMKAAMDLVGFYGGPCRSPLQPLTPEQQRKLASVFDEFVVKT